MKTNSLLSGKYIVAVSGGVDSVVLLDLLAKQKGLELVVAHFNHGIRQDSAQDEKLVIDLAKKYGLDFVVGYGELGEDSSEDAARQARYDFLNKVRLDKKADGIVTAHHKDDLLETAVSNILRGTSGRGIQSMLSNKQIIRPLLDFDKQQILDYAKKHKLQWREDSTNQDEKYLRNYIRKNLLNKFDASKKSKLHTFIYKQQKLTSRQDTLIAELVERLGNLEINRSGFIELPHDVAREVMVGWLRLQGIMDFDKDAIERLVIAGKTAKSGSNHDVLKGAKLTVDKDTLKLTKN